MLSEEDFLGGCFNDGYTIAKGKAEMMAERLENVLLEKEKYNDLVGKSEELYLNMENNIEEKLGQNKSKKCSYQFDWENFEEFYEFVKSSGGFQIY